MVDDNHVRRKIPKFKVQTKLLAQGRKECGISRVGIGRLARTRKAAFGPG